MDTRWNIESNQLQKFYRSDSELYVETYSDCLLEYLAVAQSCK